MSRNLRKSPFINLFRDPPCGETFRFWTVRYASSHCAPGSALAKDEGDHFQPHYRMPFALKSGRKEGLFFVDAALPVHSLVKCCTPASHANIGDCEFNTVMRVRVTLSPPRSLDCREILLASRRNTRIMPVFCDYP